MAPRLLLLWLLLPFASPASAQVPGCADVADRQLSPELAALQSQLEAQILLISVATLTLGVIILLAALVQGRKVYALAAVVGAMGAILVAPVASAGLGADLGPHAPWALPLFAIYVAVLATFIVRAALEHFTDFRDHIRGQLDPERWPGAAATSDRDLVRRWFVAIAAATGAAVGGLMGIGAFWKSLAAAIEPRNLVLAVLLVAVSMFLIGPIQSYVLDVGTGAKEPSEPSRKIADILSHGDWRAAGRLGLVLLAYVQLYVLSSCVGATVKQGDARVLYTVVTAGVTPAVISYYWSAALQQAKPSVLRSTLEPSLLGSAVMIYGLALMLTILLLTPLMLPAPGSGSSPQSGMLLMLVPVIAIGLALVMSALNMGLFAVAGGYALDRAPERWAILWAGAALLAAALAHALIVTLAAWLAGLCPGNIRYETFLLGVLGWVAGLWANGFPRLVAAARGGR